MYQKDNKYIFFIIIVALFGCNKVKKVDKSFNCDINHKILYDFDSLPFYSDCIEKLIISDDTISILLDTNIAYPNLQLISILSSKIENIENLVVSISKIKSLKKFEIDLNSLSNVPKELSTLKNVENLVIWGNTKIESIPNIFFDLKQLKELSLINFQFQSLSDTVLSFGNLNTLDLDNCNLKQLPNFVFEIKTLENLSVNNNPIEEIPDKLSNLSNLKTLSIANTNIESKEIVNIGKTGQFVLYPKIKRICHGCKIYSRIELGKPY